MENAFFRKLDAADVEKFVTSARKNYAPGDEVNPLWHPVYRAECERMNAEEVQGRPD